VVDPGPIGPGDLLATVFELAPDAMVITGHDGRIRLLNAEAERLFGHTRDELIGQSIEVLLPARSRAAHVEARLTYVQAPRPTGFHRNVELHAVHKNGTEFPVEVSLGPVLTASGLFIASAIRDITERKRLEARALEASRLKEELLANMSHELRTPLNAVIGFAELMHSGKVGPLSEQQAEYLGDILVSSRHLLHLINDVLDTAKFESGQMQFTHQPVDLGELVDEILDALRSRAENRHLAVECEVDGSIGEVVVDPARVKQILYNFLSNAIKFSPDGGRIRVRVAPDGPDRFGIEVEDAGVGIAPDLIPHLFKEFTQLDASTAKRYQGAGLGLALTRRIAEGHGGQVSVRSAPGEGSTFRAVLPRQSGGERPAGVR
jgi:PAS domain S-box-containing protein